MFYNALMYLACSVYVRCITIMANTARHNSVLAFRFLDDSKSKAKLSKFLLEKEKKLVDECKQDNNC